MSLATPYLSNCRLLLAQVLLSTCEYQHQAAEAFYQSVTYKEEVDRAFLAVGKTIVGMAAMVAVKVPSSLPLA